MLRLSTAYQSSPGPHTYTGKKGTVDLMISWGACCRFLVREARALGLEVLDRCNLTVLLEPGQEDLAPFLAQNRVKVCYKQWAGGTRLLGAEQ